MKNNNQGGWVSIAGTGNKSVTWGHTRRPISESFEAPVIGACQFCHKFAVVAMPPEMVKAQPDNTSHVCHPVLNGCNQGYSLDN